MNVPISTKYDEFFLVISQKDAECKRPLRADRAWVLQSELADIARPLCPNNWLIWMYSDAAKLHFAEAKKSQTRAEYSRERLQTPARTLIEEAALSKYTSNDNDTSHYIEIIMGFDNTPTIDRAIFSHRHGREISIYSNPSEVLCHTPLNQRLAKTNFRLWQVFTELLGQIKNIDWIRSKTRPEVITSMLILKTAADCWEISVDATMAFGFDFLCQYLDVSVLELDSDPNLPRRINALIDLQSELLLASHESGFHIEPHWTKWRPQIGDDCFFVPESFWVQYHAFNNSIGLDLLTELAVHHAYLRSKT